MKILDLVLVLFPRDHALVIDSLGDVLGQVPSALELFDAADRTFIVLGRYHEFGLVFPYFGSGLVQHSIEGFYFRVHRLIIVPLGSL